MQRSYLLGSLFLLMTVAGCRSSGNQELLERELRSLEDLTYELEDALELTQEQLDSSRRENASLRRELSGSDDSGVDRPLLEPPDVDLPSPQPYYSPPDESDPLMVDPEELKEAPPFEPMPGVQGAAYQRPAAGPLQQLVQGRPPLASIGREDRPIEDWMVATVRLNSLLTGGLDADGNVGDEGVLVVLEPRNAEGQILSVPGEVSIVVLDPTKQGAIARVARWDYTADETADRYRDGSFGSRFGRGVHFRAMWPGERPQNSRLRLYVRYVTAGGKRFQAEQDIKIDMGDGRGTAEWAAADVARDSSGRLAARRRRPRWVEAENPLDRAVTRGGSQQRAARATGPRTKPDIEPSPRPAERSRPTRRARKPGWSPYR